MGESILNSFIAMFFALGLTEASKYPFSSITGIPISFNIIEQPEILSLIIGFTLLIGFLAGSYPALYLARFKPVEVLKNSGRKGSARSAFRNSLVVLQFAISIGLIICSMLVSQQMTFVSNMNLGFDKENVIIIENARALANNLQGYKNSLSKNSRVLEVASSQRIPSVKFNSPVCTPEGKDGIDIPVYINEIDYNYIGAYKMELVEGRNFSEYFPSDSSAILINESAVKKFGWVEKGVSPIGKYVEMINPRLSTRSKLYVVRVVKDFNFESLKNDMSANVMILNPVGNFIAVRVGEGTIDQLMVELESTWHKFVPEIPFQYSFLDQRFEALYQSEQKLKQIFTIFTSIAIFIACLGLLGLAAYTTEQRKLAYANLWALQFILWL
jgi:putative ABC transport system permease protein